MEGKKEKEKKTTIIGNFKLYIHTLQIFTPWKLRALGITGSLQGKPVLSMKKGCKHHKETLCMLWINPLIFTDYGETP